MKKKRPPKQDEKKKRIKGELTGISLGALAFFAFISLASYSPNDPSFTHYSAAPINISNIFGVFGSHTADLLLLFLGYAAYLVPIFLLFFSINFLLDKRAPHGKSFVIGVLGMAFSVPTALHIIASPISAETKNAGGLLGSSLAALCIPFLKTSGVLFVAVTVFLLAAVAVANFSLIVFTRGFLRMVMRFFYFVRRRLELLRREAKNIRQTKKSVGPIIETKTNHGDGFRLSNKPLSQERFDFYYTDGSYALPHWGLLDDAPKRDDGVKKELLIANSRILEAKLADFDVEAKVTEVRPGPVVTTYEVEPAAGVKITKITSLNNDIGLALRAKSIRIAPIPGKGTIGIEIPNLTREAVCLKSLLESEIFRNYQSKLSVALGEDVVGVPVITNLEKMPHLLIAGTTGSGKSVALNAMICSILFKATPDEVKFLLIDPKRIELSSYEGIPHLLHPVVCDPREAAAALHWAVEEMERRYVLIGEAGARSIEGYNRAIGKFLPKTGENVSVVEVGTVREKLPYIVIVLDELADLMMAAQKNVETYLARLAQKARAAGVHLILATQRPSVDVITGVIKANFSTRISFHVSTKVDSRTILDQQGAEDLLGAGDMLFMHSGSPELMRIHGAFVSEKEIVRVVEHIKKQRSPIYNTSITSEGKFDEEETTTNDTDEHYQSAVNIALKRGEISISFLQRQLNVGYNRAAKMVEKMEAEGLVGPADGSRMRKVIGR